MFYGDSLIPNHKQNDQRKEKEDTDDPDSGFIDGKNDDDIMVLDEDYDNYDSERTLKIIEEGKIIKWEFFNAFTP